MIMSIFEGIYYDIKWFIGNIFKIMKNVFHWFCGSIYFFQRGRRGYSDRDLWDFRSYLTKVISDGLNQMSKKTWGCPPEFYNRDDEDASFEAWKQELLYISKGFKDYNDFVVNYNGENFFKKIEVNREFKDKVLPRFFKIYKHLWD